MFLAVITLSPEPSVASAVVRWVTEAIRAVGAPPAVVIPARVEMVLNALMVVPAAFLASLVWPRLTWRDWTAAAFVLSVSVELTQGLALPDRSAQTVDVVANTAGALGGALLALLLTRSQRLHHHVTHSGPSREHA